MKLLCCFCGGTHLGSLLVMACELALLTWVILLATVKVFTPSTGRALRALVVGVALLTFATLVLANLLNCFEPATFAAILLIAEAVRIILILAAIIAIICLVASNDTSSSTSGWFLLFITMLILVIIGHCYICSHSHPCHPHHTPPTTTTAPVQRGISYPFWNYKNINDTYRDSSSVPIPS